MIYAIAVLVLLITILILRAKFRIIIRYIRQGGSDDKKLFEVKLLFFGNIIKKKISLNKTEKKDEKNKVKAKKRMKKDEKIDFDSLKKTLQDIYDYYYTLSKTLKRANSYYRKRLICEEFSFKIGYGLGDAAITGIASGFIYGIVYNILSIIDKNMVLKEPNVEVNPDFNDVKLDMDFSSILSVRYVHIIIGCTIIVFSFICAIFSKQISKVQMKF